VSRPGPLRWLRYTFGGRLPEPLHDWVRHDLTDADWRLREMVRVAVQAAVPCLVLLLLPGPLSVRILAVVLVLAGAFSVGGLFGDELRDRRLRQHGLEPPRGDR
jgi:hypothetical protein